MKIFTNMLSKWTLAVSLFIVMAGSAKAQCHPYIEKQSNGDLKFNVIFTTAQYYVEVFIKKNGVQTIATNIVNNRIQNANGSYTYSYTYPASNFSTGDKVQTRFYSYVFNQPGVFTPGPAELVWAPEYTYGQSCATAIHVSVNGSDNNSGTLNSPVRTITKGITLAVTQGLHDVKVAQGTYEEGNIQIANGVNLLGGYSSNFTSRDLSFTNYVTTIDANQPGGFGVCGSKRILYIKDLYLPTIIEGFVMTRGRVCSFGGGIYAENANQLVVIRNNKIINNASVGNGTSAGGNIYIAGGCPVLYNNIITGGFAGANFGNDLYIASTSPHCKPSVVNNTFTTEPAVYGLDKSFHSGNSYQYQAFVHVATNGNDLNAGTDEAPVKTIAKGIALAVTKNASQVRVAGGTYIEGNLTVANGVSIHGGFSPGFTMNNATTYATTIDAQQTGGMFVCGNKRVLSAENITSYTAISGFNITGGRLCGFGGGIYINNCSAQLYIRDNKIYGNSSVGNGTSSGGNIYVNNSAAKILFNQITGGFAGGGYGNEIYVRGNYSDGSKTEIAFNTITSADFSSIYDISSANVHDNIYLNAARKAATDNQYQPLEVKLVNDVLFVSTEEDNVQVEVLDMMGRSFVHSSSKETSLSGLSSGFYIIKAESNADAVTQKIYVK